MENKELREIKYKEFDLLNSIAQDLVSIFDKEPSECKVTNLRIRTIINKRLHEINEEVGKLIDEELKTLRGE